MTAISPDRVADVTYQCTKVGRIVIVFALAVAAAVIAFAVHVSGPLSSVAISTGFAGSHLALLAGVVLCNVRAQFRDVRLREARARAVRRLLVVLCVGSGISFALLLVAAFSFDITAVVVPLIQLEALSLALTAAAAITAHEVLRP